MMLSRFIPFLSSSFIAIVVLTAGGVPVRAAGEYVQVQYVTPTGAISPGAMVSFVASASGFTDPVYAVADSFSASGATTGTIDKIGNYTWAPGIYDAGRHTLTVTVSDAYSHVASTTVNLLVASNTIQATNVSPGPTVAVRRPFSFSVVTPGFTTPNFSVYDSNSRSSINGGNINSSGVFSWTPTSDELGVHQLTVGASDASGHSAQTVVNVTVVNPTVFVESLVPPGSTVQVGMPVSFLVRSVSLTSPTFGISDTFSATSSISTSAINQAGRFSWSPVSTDIGFHFLTLTVTDPYGNAASTTLALSVTNATVTSSTPAPNAIPATGASSPGATGTPSATNNYFFRTNMAIGSKSAAVGELQKRLTTLGFYTGPISGYFGPLTSASVKKFQAARGLERVGNVGPATRAALNK